MTIHGHEGRFSPTRCNPTCWSNATDSSAFAIAGDDMSTRGRSVQMVDTSSDLLATQPFELLKICGHTRITEQFSTGESTCTTVRRISHWPATSATRKGGYYACAWSHPCWRMELALAVPWWCRVTSPAVNCVKLELPHGSRSASCKKRASGSSLGTHIRRQRNHLWPLHMYSTISFHICNRDGSRLAIGYPCKRRVIARAARVEKTI